MKTTYITIENKTGFSIEICASDDGTANILNKENETIFTFSDEGEIGQFAELLTKMLNNAKE